MSRHTLAITPEINRLYQVVVGYDRPLGTFFFQAWDDKDADDPINNSFAEFDSVEDLVFAINDFLSNLIGKHYVYPFPDKLIETLHKEQCGNANTNVVMGW